MTSPGAIGVVGFLFAALTAVQVGRLTLFALDPSRTEAAVCPFDQFYVEHSCVSAYFQACKLAEARVPNLYDEKFMQAGWVGSTSTPTCIRRQTAFILNGLLIAAVPTTMTLQLGNFQIVGFAVAMLAMVLIESDFIVFGAGLLAFVAASKLFPGILVLWLALQRRWRAVAWVFAWSVVLLLLATVLWFGWTPIRASFQYKMPQLSFPLHGPINIVMTPLGGKLQH